MEDVKKLEFNLREAIIRTQESKNLLFSGKIIQADRKLQGVLVKLSEILSDISKGETYVANTMPPTDGV